MVDSATRELVIARAGNRCEYCQLPQAAYEARFNIDHIIAAQHGRDDDPTNPCLCCPKCNRKKGPNLAGIDPLTRSLVPLFHPRRDRWTEHFRWSGSTVIGLSAVGRTTVFLLDLNHESRLDLRETLIDEGLFPYGP